MRKVFVCRSHVKEGLQVTDTPHVEKLPPQTKNHCSFCHQKAHFKLFHNRVMQRKEDLLHV